MQENYKANSSATERERESNSSNTNDKKVSIIITCYNKEKYVKDAIESAINQTYKNLEIICINDCSPDNSEEIIKTFEDKIIYIKNEINKGVIYSRNKAIKCASGEYIMTLDADDTIEPDYVKKTVKILIENPKIGMVYSKAKFIGTKNKIWNLPDYDENEEIFENRILVSSLFRKSDFEKSGGYKEYMKNGWEDWDLWCTFLEMGLKPYRIDEVLFNYRKCIEKTRNNIETQKGIILSRIMFKRYFPSLLEKDDFILFLRDCYHRHKKYKFYKHLNTKLIILSIIEFVLILIMGIFMLH